MSVSRRTDGVRPVGATLLETADRAPGWRRYAPALVTFTLGLAVSIVAFLALSERHRDRQQLAFEKRVTEIVGALEVGLEVPVEVLRSVPALFEASEEVSRQEFRAFTAGALERYPGIYALEWLPLVSAAERDAYEGAARADGLTGFEFKEDLGDGRLVRAAERPVYLPIYYMEPPNEIALGFDVASEPERLAPAERAALSGETVASPRIRLVEDDPSIFSIAVFHPVYRRNAPLDQPESRRAALRGVAAEVFRVAPMVDRALRTIDTTGVALALRDDSAPDGMQALFESHPEASDNRVGGDVLRHELKFDFADRRWAVTANTHPGLVGRGATAWAVLTVGSLLSLLLASGLAVSRVISRLHRQMEAALKLGQYTLTEKLGEGAMGVVYKARHAMLRRPTAIKLLPHGVGGEERFARFEREVQMTSQLTHPNTVVIYDYGRTDGGVLYYAMEFIDGITLDTLVTIYGPLPAGRVVWLLRQACGALSEAHEAGLIHRDVKPGNLMVCIQGGTVDFVKVLDFGLVKERGDEGADLSQPGTVMGTPLYMSPEAIRSPDSVDARSDLYSLGAVGYFLLTGGPVFESDNVVDICRQHLYDEPVPPSQRAECPVPNSLEAVILRCLRKDPAQRFPSARRLAEALEACEVPAWTQAEARRWWELHEPGRLREAMPALDETS